ncbi:MAG: hypothetical protein A2Y88_05585 [Chloroflexi bacterium RBG_13_48_10]|nr:MAG: hypothetical protein A2Y88_05585 [Chloroflexi bacterium RBG_13_48_10]
MMDFNPWVYKNAQTILQGVIDCAEALGAGNHEGLKQLLDCLCLELQLCNLIGHARPEEGSEHHVSYCAEQFTSPAWPLQICLVRASCTWQGCKVRKHIQLKQPCKPAVYHWIESR